MQDGVFNVILIVNHWKEAEPLKTCDQAEPGHEGDWERGRINNLSVDYFATIGMYNLTGDIRGVVRG